MAARRKLRAFSPVTNTPSLTMLTCSDTQPRDETTVLNVVLAAPQGIAFNENS